MSKVTHEDFSSQNLEHNEDRAYRMALAEVPEREAILKAKSKPHLDRVRQSKEVLRRETWAEEASERAGINYDHDISSGESLVEDPREAEDMAYAARPAMEKYRRGKKLRRAVDIIIDNVITSGGFEGMPRTTAYLHQVAGRYFRRRANRQLEQADNNAEEARRRHADSLGK